TTAWEYFPCTPDFLFNRKSRTFLLNKKNIEKQASIVLLPLLYIQNKRGLDYLPRSKNPNHLSQYILFSYIFF
ncbi:hypothetical protein, partial [Anaerosolibacter sp.]|uniref:hypothetical protein n=1 Tax=Anaerosolibacter sp. TaxID=1872527 RepID=UPI0039EE0B09